jgi:hypothetical protein
VNVIEPKMTATNFAKNSIGKRPNWSNSSRSMPDIDPPEKVAALVEKIIKTEEAELRVE